MPNLGRRYPQYGRVFPTVDQDLSLIGYWPMDGFVHAKRSDRAATDLTTYDETGGNPSVFDPGGELQLVNCLPADSFLSFNGASPNIGFPPFIPALTPITYCIWVKPITFTSNYGGLICSSYVLEKYACLFIKSNGKLFVGGGNITAVQWYYDGTGTYTLETGKWAFICSTFGVPEYKGYVNGLLDGVNDTAGGGSPGPTGYPDASQGVAMMIGGDPIFGARFMKADMRDARIYNRILSADEIWQLYQSYLRPIPSPKYLYGVTTRKQAQFTG
jgi:hypothetical protein